MTAPNPVAFTLFGIEVRWYGILIAAAFLIGMLIAVKRAPKAGATSEDILDFFICLLPAVVIGARLYYVVFEWDYYSDHLSEIIMTWHGGLAIHGGIIAGILVGIVFCKVKKLHFFSLADCLIPALPLGQAIGRWGNFFNQEAHGTVTSLPWAIMVNDPVMGLVKVHPTFLYESIWNLLVFAFIFVYEKYIKETDGELLFLYFGLYSIGRFFIEGLRTDSLMFFNLRIAQIISLILMVIGFGGILVLRYRYNQKRNL